jgi:hypothetical protein
VVSLTGEASLPRLSGSDGKACSMGRVQGWVFPQTNLISQPEARTFWVGRLGIGPRRAMGCGRRRLKSGHGERVWRMAETGM